MLGPSSWLLLRHLGRREVVRGFEVMGAEDLGVPEKEHLDGALALVETTAPWIMAHARRDVPGLVISRGGAEIGWMTGALWISPSSLESEDLAYLSSTLVFYFTLARLRAVLGRRHRGFAFRRFRLTLERTLAFARLLPDGQAVVDHLTAAVDRGYFENTRQRELRGARIDEMDLAPW